LRSGMWFRVRSWAESLPQRFWSTSITDGQSEKSLGAILPGMIDFESQNADPFEDPRLEDETIQATSLDETHPWMDQEPQ
jgi:hypothetical protein